MEYTIDRKEYRRNSCNNYEVPKKRKIEHKESLFLSKIINSMLVLLTVLLLKLFNYDVAFNLVKEKVNSGITYDVIAEKIKEKMNLNIISVENQPNTTYVSGEISIESGEFKVSGDKTSGEKQYIEAVAGVNQFMEDAKTIKSNYKIQNPLKGMVTSKFGCRVSDNPIVSSYHTGMDIAANEGAVIVAAHDGKVIKSENSGAYGKCIMIEENDLITLYAHCSELLVKEGETVSMGQSIGKVGMTGNATGPHLHLEVRYDGRFVNPEDII